MNHDFELYASIVNFFLSPRTTESGTILSRNKQPAFKILPLLDTKTLEEVRTFKNVAVVKILQLLSRHYDQYKSLPSEIIFKDIKQNDPEFSNWYKRATPQQRQDISKLDAYLYKPVEDEQYLQELILDLSSKIQLAKLVQYVGSELSSKNTAKGVGLSVLTQAQQQIYDYKQKFDSVLSGRRSEHVMIYEEKKNAKDFQNISGIKTQYELIELRPNGLTAIFGGPKDGKTRLIISICRYLAAKGYDVLYLDLENGSREMEARVLQAEFSDLKGYPVQMEYFYSGIFIHKEFIPSYVKEWNQENTYEIERGDLIYKICVSTHMEQEDGLEREIYTIELKVFEALLSVPISDPEKENVNEWRQIPDISSIIPSEVYQPFQEFLEGTMPEIVKSKKGQIRIEYIPSAHINEIESSIASLIKDPRSDFFSKPKQRVAVVDWMQLVQNQGKIWEKTRDNYSRLKSLQGLHDMYILVVDGVKDFSQLKELHPNLEKAGTTGTSQTDYNVVSSVLFCTSDEEKRTRTARLVSKRSRYGKSGTEVQEYLLTDEAYSTIEVIDKETHKNLNPELWEEKKKKERTNDIFDGIDL